MANSGECKTHDHNRRLGRRGGAKSCAHLGIVAGYSSAIRTERIRAKRQKPGLLRQHLTAVEAARTVGCAEVAAAEMNSQIIEFRLQAVTPGNYRFAVGTAGSATLVLQTMEAVQAARTWLEAEVPV